MAIFLCGNLLAAFLDISRVFFLVTIVLIYHFDFSCMYEKKTDKKIEILV